ncbi:PIN domain nuclease of toxin-antitoxin system [Rhizobium sp. PP-CC-3A-592]|nr:PIN domain nuclease of toxin-antitoxin system [Rhizobium sp. PP-CC-3A-592]
MPRLLDTHIFIALLEGRSEQLPASVRQEIQAKGGALYLSVASLWEIAIKSRIGKLPLHTRLHDLPDAARQAGLILLPINEHHALHTISPEPSTRDPFDRLLLAQCAIENMRLVTIDRALADHPLSATAAP